MTGRVSSSSAEQESFNLDLYRDRAASKGWQIGIDRYKSLVSKGTGIVLLPLNLRRIVKVCNPNLGMR